MRALGPLFMMSQQLVVKISLVFVILEEDNALVHILITTHPSDSNLGSEESPHPMLSLDPLFMMIQPLVIEILPVSVVLLGWGQHFVAARYTFAFLMASYLTVYVPGVVYAMIGSNSLVL